MSQHNWHQIVHGRLQNRFQQALQQLEDGTLITKAKKEIAQIKTILNEYKLGIRAAQGEVE